MRLTTAQRLAILDLVAHADELGVIQDYMAALWPVLGSLEGRAAVAAQVTSARKDRKSNRGEI